jgi:predicted secreted protein
MARLALGQANNGECHEVSLADTIVIRLKGNAAAGYTWEVEEADEQILTQKGRHPEFALPGDAQCGSPVLQEIRFQATGVGTAPIRLKYWREWLGDASVLERYDVRITVRSR